MRLGGVLFLSLFAALLASAGSVYGVDNFYKVTPGVYRGSHPDAEALQQLHKLGIKTIVSLQGEGKTLEEEKRLAGALGIKVLSFPLTTFDPTPGEGRTRESARLAAQQAMEAAVAELGRPENQPVYLHCKFGRDRTGVVAGLYLAKFRQAHEATPRKQIVDQVWENEVVGRGYRKGLQFLKHLYWSHFDAKSARALGIAFVEGAPDSAPGAHYEAASVGEISSAPPPPPTPGPQP